MGSALRYSVLLVLALCVVCSFAKAEGQKSDEGFGVASVWSGPVGKNDNVKPEKVEVAEKVASEEAPVLREEVTSEEPVVEVVCAFRLRAAMSACLPSCVQHAELMIQDRVVLCTGCQICISTVCVLDHASPSNSSLLYYVFIFSHFYRTNKYHNSANFESLFYLG